MSDATETPDRISFRPAWIVAAGFAFLFVAYAIFGSVVNEGGSSASVPGYMGAGMVPVDPDQVNFPDPNRTKEDMYVPGPEPAAGDAEASEG